MFNRNIYIHHISYNYEMLDKGERPGRQNEKIFIFNFIHPQTNNNCQYIGKIIVQAFSAIDFESARILAENDRYLTCDDPKCGASYQLTP